MIADLRVKVHQHIVRLPVQYYDSNVVGALASRVMDDVEGVRHLLETSMLDFAGALFTAVFALVMLVRLNAVMTLVSGALLCLLVLSGRLATGSMRALFRENAEIACQLRGRLTESLAAIRELKIYQAEEKEHNVFRNKIHQLLRSMFSILTKGAVLNIVLVLTIGAITGVVIIMGAKRTLIGQFTLGSFFTYMMFLGYLFSPLSQVPNLATKLNESATALERTQEVLREVPEDKVRCRTLELHKFQGHLAFDNVGFRYTKQSQVLRDVSFECPPDSLTALIGPSGAGKSTIISLAAGLYDPSAGHVLADGVDVSMIRLDHYRKYLGVVFQESFLFDGTIRENVLFGRPNASSSDFYRACSAACLNEFVEKFECGFETKIGERGTKLSGGQRQRIAIARALLANPRLLLLDEATSNLDSESEALIQQALFALTQGRTTLVVTHRLLTIRNADQVLVLEKGRIIQQGSPRALIQESGYYRRLYEGQRNIGTSVAW